MTTAENLIKKQTLLRKVEILIENKDNKMLETYKKELSELPESELYLLKAEVYFTKELRNEALDNLLLACIYDKSKYEEVTALIRGWFLDMDTANKIKEEFFCLLRELNKISCPAKEKFEYLKSCLKNDTINVDTISNIYVNAKAGRKIDF